MGRDIDKKVYAFIKNIAIEILNDKNRLAKAIATHVRNGIENFHWKYLSDDNMREINPRIRNAIYTFLVDFKKDVCNISAECDTHECIDYIAKSAYIYLLDIGISNELIGEFDEAIFERIYESFYDISNGGMMMAELEILRVPKYWEDCLYLNLLSNSVKC